MRGSDAGPAPGGAGGALSTVRAGRRDDAGAAASLHASLISEGFLSSLGPRFLRRLYRRIAVAQGSFLLVAEGDGDPVGFLAGSMAVGRLYRTFVLRDGVGAVLRAPVRLLRAAPTALETLRHGRDEDEGAGGAPGAQGELLSVAVDPRWRGRQVGAHLVDAFLDEVRRRGGRSARVVVGAANAPAIAMYRRAGFTPTCTFEFHRGVPSLLMETALPARPGGGPAGAGGGGSAPAPGRSLSNPSDPSDPSGPSGGHHR
ncbi:MAG: GNAT family N-acetyltransferase [Acidimicrobiales bacterium]